MPIDQKSETIHHTFSQERQEIEEDLKACNEALAELERGEDDTISLAEFNKAIDAMN